MCIRDRIDVTVEVVPETPLKLPHTPNGAKITLDLHDYIDDVIAHYKQLSGKTSIRKAVTPFVPDGTLHPDDWDVKGELAANCTSCVMKSLWASRLSRPDTQKPTCDLASNVSKWSRNDDKRMERLIGYYVLSLIHI